MADNEPLLFRVSLGALRPNVTENVLSKGVTRFLQSFTRGEGDECWIWTGRTRPSGYGLFNLGPATSMQATHVVLGAYKGPPPFPGAFALHSCDNPRCVNPNHLRWGTSQDNADDREKRGRSVKPKGEQHGHAKLTDSDVLFIRSCGLSLREMKARFGVSIRVLSLARAGKTWRHLNG